MTLRTSLVIAGDASGATAALSATDAAMKSAEAEAQALAKAYSSADAAIGQLAKEQAAATREIQASKAAFNAGEISVEQYNRELLETKSALSLVQREHRAAINELAKAQVAHRAAEEGMKRVNTVTGQQRAGLSQLSMNLSDVTTMYNLGAKTSQIFASQSGQVIQAVIMMVGETSKFAMFMQGPWGIALTAATLILAPFVGKLFEAEEATKKTADANETLVEKLDRSKHSWDEVIAATREYNGEQRRARQVTLDAARATAGQTAQNLQNALSIREQLKAELERQQAQRGGILAPQGYQAEQLRIEGQLSARIVANDKAIKELATGARNAVNAVGAELGKLAADPRYAIEQRFLRSRIQLDDLKLSAADYASRTAALNRQEQAALDALTKAERERNKAVKERMDLQRFAMPVAGAQTGSYGEQRTGHRHAGLDIAAPIGTPVKAPYGGVVIESGRMGAYGNVIFIDHGGGTITRLAHLSSLGAAKGTVVDQGDVVGAVGSTGRSTGPHLHYEVRVNGKPVDPRKGMFPVDPADVAATGEKARASAERAAQKVENQWTRIIQRAVAGQQKLEQFGTSAAETIARTNEQFDEQPKFIDQAAAATRRLDTLIKELGDRKPQGFEKLIAEANTAKGTIQDALVRPFREMEQSSQRRVQIQQMLAEGRDAEAAALQEVWRIEEQLGTEEELRKHVQDLIVAGRADEAAILQQMLAIYPQLRDQAAQRAAAEWRSLDAISQQREQVNALGSAMSRIGGAGGDILGVLTSRNPVEAMLGMGGVGTLLGSVLSPSTFKKQGDQIAESLSKVFGIKGAFGQTLTSALQGSSIGGIAAQSILGSNANSTGSAIGGALGGIAGKAFEKGATKALTSALGKGIGGAIGSAIPVIGSILGGLLGGLFGKSMPYGTAAITNSGVNVNQNDGDSGQAAGQAGGSVQDTIRKIATQFGGSVGSYAVSVGVKDGHWRYSTIGRTDKMSSQNADVHYTGDGDAGMKKAISLAIADAVKDGALLGVRASTQALLGKGEDIESQLEKALKFENVFKQFAADANPLKASLDELGKQAEELRGIFAEAGATAEEYAQLEASLTKQREKAIAQAGAGFVNAFFNTQQKADLARWQVGRELGPMGLGYIDTVDEFKGAVLSLGEAGQNNIELYGKLLSLTEQFTIIQEAADEQLALAISKRSMEIELMRLQGKTSEALFNQRIAELLQMDESLRGIQLEIWAQQDLAAAKDKLTEAYRRESGELEETISKFGDMAQDLRDYRDTLYAGAKGADSYQTAMVRLLETGSLAAVGDAEAMGRFTGVAGNFLDASKSNAASYQQYQRDLALVARMTDQAIGSAEGQVDVAQLQLDELKSQVSALVSIEESVLSVRDAILAVQGLGGTPIAPTALPARQQSQAERDAAARTEEANRRIEELLENILVGINRQGRTLKAWDRAGALAVATDSDTPLVTVPAE